MCKRAKIAAVLIALPDADNDRRKSFYDTTRIVDGLAYLFALAECEKMDAVSINISLGTNGGAHDGSEMVSRWIDAAMTSRGASITVAAGNSGQEAPQYEGDLGIWSGRVHSSGRIPAAALRRDLEWVVVGNGLEDVSENELEIWYGAQDEFDVELFTPAAVASGRYPPGQRVENLLLEDRTVVSIYNVLSDPKNGDNRISIYLSPYMGEPIVGITAGSWRVRLIGKVVRNGAYNAWIERDDPGRIGGLPKTQWRLPSFFGPKTFVDDSTLSSLACGPRVIGVANLDEARELLNVSSSQGPTRDERMKPEIAAPGTEDRRRLRLRSQRQMDRDDRHQHGQPLCGRRRRPDAVAQPETDRSADRRHHPADLTARCRARVTNGRTARVSASSIRRPASGRSCVISAARRRPHREAADMKIEVFPSASGDCVLITSNDDKRLLADAGLPDAYRRLHRRAAGGAATQQKAIDVAYVSHIDRDHIGGVLQDAGPRGEVARVRAHAEQEPEVQAAQGAEAAGGPRNLAQRLPGGHRQDRSGSIRHGAWRQAPTHWRASTRPGSATWPWPSAPPRSRCSRSASATRSR